MRPQSGIHYKLDHMDELHLCIPCHHLVQEGNKKLIAWFGKAMFLDKCDQDGQLDADVTPLELLDHLEATHATSADELDCFNKATKAFNDPCEQKKPVEEYLMRLQQTQADSEDLGIGFTDKQIITQALW